MTTFELVAWFAVAAVSVPLLVLTIECAAALWPHRIEAIPSGIRPHCAVLIPAHNEEAGISHTLHAVIPQLLSGDRLLVVADNCTDRTADVARTKCCEVLERPNAIQRGKGYALAFGVDHLRSDPPDVVVILDADCIALPGAIDRLVREAARTARPVQAAYLMDAPEGSGPDRQVASFAFTVKNVVRPLGLRRLGLPCLLTGTGMAFPWEVIATANLGHGHIVEDMQLAVDLTWVKRPIRFLPEAHVRGEFPIADRGVMSQRRRWEHGHLAVMLSRAPRLVLAGISRLRWDLLGLGFELAVPPVSALAIVIVGLLSALGLAVVLGESADPLLGLGIVTTVCVVTLVGTWIRFGREKMSGFALMSIPFYALRKISLYVSFVLGRERKWVRTER